MKKSLRPLASTITSPLGSHRRCNQWRHLARLADNTPRDPPLVATNGGTCRGLRSKAHQVPVTKNTQDEQPIASAHRPDDIISHLW